MSGAGKPLAVLDFLPKDHQLEAGSIVYTSGTDGVFHAGIPIGKIQFSEEELKVKFFSDLDQLYIVNVITSKPMINEN